MQNENFLQHLIESEAHGYEQRLVKEGAIHTILYTHPGKWQSQCSLSPRSFAIDKWMQTGWNTHSIGPHKSLANKGKQLQAKKKEKNKEKNPKPPCTTHSDLLRAIDLQRCQTINYYHPCNGFVCHFRLPFWITNGCAMRIKNRSTESPFVFCAPAAPPHPQLFAWPALCSIGPY